jgi:hypothetical protein
MQNLEFLSNSSVVHSRVYIFLAFFYDAPGNGVSWKNLLKIDIMGPSKHETDLV